jgi:predicted esterase
LRPCNRIRGGLLFFVAAAACAGELEPGRVTDRVVCREKPDQSYALSLPAAYAGDRPWPIVYLLDARGRALYALERFRAAAETYGWILASSYNSRSDTKDDPNTPALQAMWNDTHGRLAVDPRRTYLAGFSGGGRAAVALALRAPKAIAGVIGCSAGFLDEKAPLDGLPFPYFGTSGDRDFNYYEMRALDAGLEAAKAPHRIAFFEGGHDWPPPAVASDAVAWMELGAMRAGTRSRDEALAASLLASQLLRADALAAAGRQAEAYLAYAHAAEDFRGLADVGPAAEKAAALGGTASVRRALGDAGRRDDRDRGALRVMAQKLRAALREPDIPPAAAVAADLGVGNLKRRAASGSPDERLSAERLLANLRVQTSFYLPEELFAKKDWAHARLVLAVAAEIDPDDPRVDYNLASADARSGQGRRARKELERAVEKGFRRFELLDEDPDFASLRADPDFRTWLAEARARAATPGPSPP